MHYIGKEQMHTYCNPLFSIFLSKFYLKYKFYQNVKKQRKKEVFLQMLYIFGISHFIINVFMMSQLFFKIKIKKSSLNLEGNT